MRSVRLRIAGRVQGVGYRAWMMRQATALGLRGWVRNRADGSVEALVIADEDRVATMIDACREGPFGARVSEVAVSEAADDGSPGFTAERLVASAEVVVPCAAVCHGRIHARRSADD
jgi:acylphosphatase